MVKKTGEVVALSCPPPNGVTDNKQSTAPLCDSYTAVGGTFRELWKPLRGAWESETASRESQYLS